MSTELDAAAEPTADATDEVETESDRHRQSQRVLVGLVVASLVIAAFTLWREAESEPYHIDELRQVRPYGLGFRELIRRSFTQDQPPLDVIVGSKFREILGVGDVIQRSHSVLAGLTALALLAVLMWRSGARRGAPAVVIFLAVMPGFLSFTAYARPYALPLFLMVAFTLACDVWLKDSRRIAAGAATVVALLLPLSRTLEPPLFLILSSLTILWFRRTNVEWGRRHWWPIGSAAAALLLVELPVYLRLGQQLSEYQGESEASLGDQLRRVLDDSIPRFAEMFVSGWYAVIIVVVALSFAGVRRWLRSTWWYWPFLATVVCFAVLFHIRTQPSQPFYDRYAYFWLPVFAVLVGVLVHEATGPSLRTTRSVVALVVLLPFAALSVVATARDLDEQDYADYHSLGREVESRVPATTALVYDSTTRPLGSYRPGYAGYGRYTSPTRPIIKAEAMPFQAGRIGPGDEYVIGTDGPRLEIDGWTAIAASDTMTLYLPDEPRSGPSQLADDLVSFGRELEPARGAVLRIAAAAVLFEIGDVEPACDELGALRADLPEAYRSQLDGRFVDTPFEAPAAACQTT